MTKLTDDELALLTDEERAGLEEDQGDTAGETGEVATAAETGADPNASEEGAAADDAAQALTDTATSPPAADATTAAADTKPAAEPYKSQPLLRDTSPADADAKIKEIAAAREALAAKLDAGDMTTKEFSNQTSELFRQEQAIHQQVMRGEIAREMAQRQAEDNWYRDVHEFLSEHPDIRGNDLRLRSFDAAVRAVTGSDAAGSMTNRQMLTKALSDYKEAFGAAAPAAASRPAAASSAPAALATPASPTPKKDIPPTLAKVPAAASTETETKYANLDSLAESDPVRFETVLAQMPETERNAYLEGR